MARLEVVIQACGLTCEPWAGGFAITGPDGFSRRFQSTKDTEPRLTNCQVVWAHSNPIQVRPLNLGDNPQDYPATQTEYELLKKVFDQTSAIECFGFHASQDNGVVFEGLNPGSFGDHLALASAQLTRSDATQRLLLVKSWNEWAEGNHLEPNRRHGLRYLQQLLIKLSTPGPR